MRFADARRGKGKRGGLRVIYYWWDSGMQFWLFTLYDKDEMPDLTPLQRKALKAMIKAEAIGHPVIDRAGPHPGGRSRTHRGMRRWSPRRRVSGTSTIEDLLWFSRMRDKSHTTPGPSADPSS